MRIAEVGERRSRTGERDRSRGGEGTRVGESFVNVSIARVLEHAMVSCGGQVRWKMRRRECIKGSLITPMKQTSTREYESGEAVVTIDAETL